MLIKKSMHKEIVRGNFTIFIPGIPGMAFARDRNRKSVTLWNIFNFRLIFSHICYLLRVIMQKKANISF
jgi:hypothetical protein